MKKALIGIGCSWTQGEGGYPEELWKEYNGKINLPIHKSMHLIPYEHKNSWVNVLTREYFKDFTPVNLGQRGIGNRGSARSLYLSNINWNKLEDGIVIFMLSGFERLDFFRVDWNRKDIAGFLNYKNAAYYNFQTVWPHSGHSELWTQYAKHVYAEEATAIEQVCNILEVQNFCKVHNLKFVLANAFDGRGKEFLVENTEKISDAIDWTCYVHEGRKFSSYVDLLVEKDGIIKPDEHYYDIYKNLKWPQKHLTNCIHPTIEGYKVIAEDLANFILERHYK